MPLQNESPQQEVSTQDLLFSAAGLMLGLYFADPLGTPDYHDSLKAKLWLHLVVGATFGLMTSKTINKIRSTLGSAASNAYDGINGFWSSKEADNKPANQVSLLLESSLKNKP